MRESALGASCIFAATFCFTVRGFYTRWEGGWHRHKIATDGEKKRSWKEERKEERLLFPIVERGNDKLTFLQKGFSLWNCSVAGQILFLTCMDGFCPLINPVQMFQMAIVSAPYFGSFTTSRGSWGLTFPLENNALFLHPLFVSQKALNDKFCRVVPCQRRAQQYWDLQVMKVRQRESTTTNRSQVKVPECFWPSFSRPVLVPPSCQYCTIAILGSSQRYQKRPLLWGVCSLSPMAVSLRSSARWRLHGGDKATRWNSACPGAPLCVTLLCSPMIWGGGGGGVQEGMRDSGVVVGVLSILSWPQQPLALPLQFPPVLLVMGGHAAQGNKLVCLSQPLTVLQPVMHL